MGLIPVGDLDYFFVPRLCHVDYFTFHKVTNVANVEAQGYKNGHKQTSPVSDTIDLPYHS